MAEGEKSEKPGHLNEILRIECKSGSVTTVALLLAAGANPNVCDEFGDTAFSIAVRAACPLVLLQQLLFAGAIPTVHVSLLPHVKANNTAAVECLLDHGVPVNRLVLPGSTHSIVWFAAEHSPAMVELLLSAGAILTESDKRSIMLAALKNYLPMSAFTKLLQAGAIATALGASCLHRSLEANSHLVRHLLDLGVSVNAVDSATRTALHSLAEQPNNSCNLEVLEILLAYGIDVNGKDWSGRTAVDCLLALWHSRTHELLELLLEAGADTNERPSVASPLLMATMRRDARSMRLLLQRGALIDKESASYALMEGGECGEVIRTRGLIKIL